MAIEWEASVVKLETENGFFCFQPGVINIGDTLRVDLESRRDQTFDNARTGTEFIQEIVENLNAAPGTDRRLIPVELLDIA